MEVFYTYQLQKKWQNTTANSSEDSPVDSCNTPGTDWILNIVSFPSKTWLMPYQIAMQEQRYTIFKKSLSIKSVFLYWSVYLFPLMIDIIKLSALTQKTMHSSSDWHKYTGAILYQWTNKSFKDLEERYNTSNIYLWLLMCILCRLNNDKNAPVNCLAVVGWENTNKFHMANIFNHI